MRTLTWIYKIFINENIYKFIPTIKEYIWVFPYPLTVTPYPHNHFLAVPSPLEDCPSALSPAWMASNRSESNSNASSSRTASVNWNCVCCYSSRPTCSGCSSNSLTCFSTAESGNWTSSVVKCWSTRGWSNSNAAGTSRFTTSSSSTGSPATGTSRWHNSAMTLFTNFHKIIPFFFTILYRNH